LWLGPSGAERTAVRGSPFPLSKGNVSFAESCAQVWWNLRRRTPSGMEWANDRLQELQEQLRRTPPTIPAAQPGECQVEPLKKSDREIVAARIERTRTDIVALRNGHAFFSAYPRRIMRIQHLTAKSVYWTLVDLCENLRKDVRKKSGVRREVRNENGDFVRESRLKAATMVMDEKSLWFLMRNGYLHVGDQEAHYEAKRKDPNPKVGKCCMCGLEKETWEHVLGNCSVFLRWVSGWAVETPGMTERPLTSDGCKELVLIEAERMSRLQVELFSKLWCAWYDMRTAWRAQKLKTTKKMKAYWKSKWRKRLARAIEVDMRTNTEKATKKWDKLIIWTVFNEWKLAIPKCKNEGSYCQERLIQAE
jgi:hypothetical protein